MSPAKKRRTEINEKVAAELQFAFDRTCCVCRVRSKPFQIHHIDEDPANGETDNLAVLCLECHHQTQVRGGFGRKLDAAQIRAYKSDWLARVENKRDAEQGTSKPKRALSDRAIRYMQLHDGSDEWGYEFRADYPLFRTGNEDVDTELDTTINFYILSKLQRFRGIAFSRRADIGEMRKQHPAVFLSYHQIGFQVRLFTATILSIEFFHDWYFGGAAHPNHNVETLNFRLAPTLQLEIDDLFTRTELGLAALAQICITSILDQKRNKVASDHDHDIDPWLRELWVSDTERGANATLAHYKRFVLVEGGMRVHFDPYQVGCYAEGAYVVDVPWYSLKDTLDPELKTAMSWAG